MDYRGIQTTLTKLEAELRLFPNSATLIWAVQLGHELMQSRGATSGQIACWLTEANLQLHEPQVKLEDRSY